jgi:hypothetical protein
MILVDEGFLGQYAKAYMHNEWHEGYVRAIYTPHIAISGGAGHHVETARLRVILQTLKGKLVDVEATHIQTTKEPNDVLDRIEWR